MNANNKGIKLRYALIGIVGAAAIGVYLGGVSAQPEPPQGRQPTYAENCAKAVAEDIYAHNEMRKLLRQAEASAREQDYLSQLCENEPEKCGEVHAEVQ